MRGKIHSWQLPSNDFVIIAYNVYGAFNHLEPMDAHAGSNGQLRDTRCEIEDHHCVIISPCEHCQWLVVDEFEGETLGVPGSRG